MHGDDDQIVPYANSAPLSAKLLKNGVLKTYPGLPHGMCTTHADVINKDLLAFVLGEELVGRGFARSSSSSQCPPDDATPVSELIATRGAQMFPRLTDEELSRLARFGEPRSYRAGEMLARVGEVGPGLALILSGQVDGPQDDHGTPLHIVTHERGNFMGELAQLSGRPYLVNARRFDRRRGSGDLA